MLYAAVLTVLLIYTKSCLGQYLHCGMAHVEYTYFGECTFNIFDNFFDNVKEKGIANKEEFLIQLGAVCSNQSALNMYYGCVNNVESACPEQAAYIESYFNRQLTLYCEKNNVSSWLQTFLRNGYSFNKTCTQLEVFGNLTETTCSPIFQELSELSQNITITFAEGMLIKQRMATDLFHCVARSLSEEGLECGSSWQDALLTHWLSMSSSYPFLYLPGKEMAQIKISS